MSDEGEGGRSSVWVGQASGRRTRGRVGRDGCAVEALSTQCGPIDGSSGTPALRVDGCGLTCLHCLHERAHTHKRTHAIFLHAYY